MLVPRAGILLHAGKRNVTGGDTDLRWPANDDGNTVRIDRERRVARFGELRGARPPRGRGIKKGRKKNEAHETGELRYGGEENGMIGLTASGF